MTRRTSFLFVGLLWVAVFGTLALSALPAHGQAAWLPACAASAPTYPTPEPTPPPGKPAQWGGSCSVAVHTSTVGAAAALLCPRSGGGAPDARLYAVRWSALTPQMATDFAALPFQPAASAVEFQRKYASTSVFNLGDVWCPARDRFNAAYLAATTPAVQWKVAPFGTQTTRPVFAVAAGRRAATATAGIRAPVGAACDCTAPIVEGLVTYCPAATTGALVAVCVKP